MSIYQENDREGSIINLVRTFKINEIMDVFVHQLSECKS